MSEAIEVNPNPFIQEEVEKVRFLQGLVDRPEVFLFAQNALLYDRDLSHLRQDTSLNEIGLPASTDEFYQREDHEAPRMGERLPRVLNIGSGGEAARKMAAINVDVSADGKPDVVADARHLPFASESFTVVRASHVLEHIPQEEILPTLREWRRVLHTDGALHIAVPDAEVTFKEIIDGQTPKGAPAYSLTESTAPLAQIYGLGYENPNTDKRWGHTIIFSYALLEHYLRAAGFTHIERRTKQEDLAYLSGVDDDSQNHYTLLVSASHEKMPHTTTGPLAEKAFRDKCKDFKEDHPDIPAATFVVPVHNEAKNLPHFLAFLENSQNQTDTQREFIFVVNGCTDGSEDIIRKYLEQSFLNARVVTSETGIIPAFKKGVEERTLQGFIGKLDADAVLHPHALDLMQMNLVENGKLQVTYAESTPLDSQSIYNQAEHNPILRSKRLYYHGRTSLYREDPFLELAEREIPPELKAEDIFLSFYYTYFYGLNSVAPTPHALVYAKTVGNFEDLVHQVSRSGSEIERVYKAYPPFSILGKVLEREVYPGQYRSLTDRARGEAANNVAEWTRLGSTK
jgi:glycosyltransferase involved in cell wall biosynthesis/SAM-dependent methyltransferase